MSNLYKNILVLASGSVLARLIGIVSIPIITRLYSPADMGVLSTFISITGVLVAFTTLCYSVVIPLPRTLSYALNSSLLCLIILSIVSVLLFFIFFLFNQPIFQFFNLMVLNNYWALLPISVFLFGLAEILNVWTVRYKNFKLISATNVFQSSIGALSKIILGLLNANPLGLIVGQIVVQAGSVITLLNFYFVKFNRNKISFKKILFIAKYYIDIPKFRLPSQILLSLSTNMPILFFSSFLGSDVTGQLGLALMVLSLPISLLGQTIGQAFYGEIATIGRKNPLKIQKISHDILKKLLLVSFIPFIVLVIFGDDLFRLVFGPEWTDAGVYSRVLALYMIANLTSAPMVTILNIYARNLFFFWLNFSRILLLLAVFSASILFEFNAVKVLVLYSISLTFHYVVVTVLIFKVLEQEVVRFVKA